MNKKIMKTQSIAIVTDSTADIPDSVLETYDIHMVNNYVVIDGKSIEDRKEITRSEFYTALPHLKEIPTTATASIGIYQKLYEQLFAEGKDLILSIHASAKLSGIFNAASAAANYFYGKVKVIDSLSLSMGLGFQVIAAAQAASIGLSLDAIMKRLENLRQRIKLIAMLDTLMYVHRSGRVSWAKAWVGEFLSFKPFLEVINGQVLNLGEVRTYRKGFQRLVAFLRKYSPIESLAILHTNAEEQAKAFLEEVRDILPNQFFIVNVTTVIGSHTGPNGLGFAVVRKESETDW
ncbi:MAG: DegV family protein [Anaerolineales bacterium]